MLQSTIFVVFCILQNTLTWQKKHLENAAYSTATFFISEPEAVVIVTNSK